MYWKPCKFNVTPRNKEADDSVLKGHSQLWKRADLDTSFLTLKKSSLQPEIKVHLEMRFNFCNVCLIFNRLLKNLVLSVLLVRKSVYRVFVICKLAMKWYLMRMCAS